MATAHRSTTADKQAFSKKLLNILKKRYKKPPEMPDLPVLQTMLYAACLENGQASMAETVLSRLQAGFHDLNEMRVSSITELVAALGDVEFAEVRAMRIRGTLHYVFEKQFAFDFEVLRRKSLEQADRQLHRIKELSPFIRLYTLQSVLGVHAVPLDDRMARTVIWLGLVDPNETPEQAAESLKSVIRKADAQHFCESLRCLACDPELVEAFEFDVSKPPAEGFNLQTAAERLEDLFKHPKKRLAKKGAARRTPAKKAPARAPARSKTPARRPSTKKSRTGQQRVAKKK